MGIIRKNLSLEQQAAEVAKVKKFEAGVIRDPITVGGNHHPRRAGLTQAHNISGVPVVGNDGLLAGIVTHRDMRFETELDDPVRHIMTKKDRLITVKEGAASDEVLQLLHRQPHRKVLVVNDSFELRGLITVRTSEEHRFPERCQGPVDPPAGRRCRRRGWRYRSPRGSAGRRRRGRDRGRYRARPLAGPRQLGQKNFPNVRVIGGNICTGEAALALLDSGADAVKVGIGGLDLHHPRRRRRRRAAGHRH